MNPRLPISSLQLAKRIIGSDWGNPLVWQNLRALDVDYDKVLDTGVVVVMHRCKFYTDNSVELDDEGVTRSS